MATVPGLALGLCDLPSAFLGPNDLLVDRYHLDPVTCRLEVTRTVVRASTCSYGAVSATLLYRADGAPESYEGQCSTPVGKPTGCRGFYLSLVDVALTGGQPSQEAFEDVEGQQFLGVAALAASVVL